MIFVTVGTQLPFPRLTSFMAKWAASHGEQVVLQTGDRVKFQSCDSFEAIESQQFAQLVTAARVVVSHAGIGSVLAAKEFRRPLILVPRQAKLGEHRNDHQLATARSLEGRSGLRIAWDMDAIPRFLGEEIEPPDVGIGPGYDGLVQRIREFVTV